MKSKWLDPSVFPYCVSCSVGSKRLDPSIFPYCFSCCVGKQAARPFHISILCVAFRGKKTRGVSPSGARGSTLPIIPRCSFFHCHEKQAGCAPSELDFTPVRGGSVFREEQVAQPFQCKRLNSSKSILPVDESYIQGDSCKHGFALSELLYPPARPRLACFTRGASGVALPVQAALTLP